MLSLEDGREIRFRDIRKFGKVGLYAGRRRGRGDPFDGDRTRATRRRLHGAGLPEADPRPTGRLKPLLLDQTFVAGVGNIYADEALWAPASTRSGPLGRSGRPTSAGCAARSRAILAEAVARRGSSVDDYTAPEGDGEMQEHLRVYQRTGEPCLRCGRPIRRIVDRHPGDALLLVVPAPARRRRPAAATILRDDGAADPAPRRRWPEAAGAGRSSAGDGALGADDSTRRGGPRPQRTRRTRGRDPPRRGAGRRMRR